jgi:hypothetical protein
MEIAKLTTDLTRSDNDIIQDSHTSPNYYVAILDTYFIIPGFSKYPFIILE